MSLQSPPKVLALLETPEGTEQPKDTTETPRYNTRSKEDRIDPSGAHCVGSNNESFSNETEDEGTLKGQNSGESRGENNAHKGENNAHKGENNAHKGENNAQKGENNAQKGENGAHKGENGALRSPMREHRTMQRSVSPVRALVEAQNIAIHSKATVSTIAAKATIANQATIATTSTLATIATTSTQATITTASTLATIATVTTLATTSTISVLQSSVSFARIAMHSLRLPTPQLAAEMHMQQTRAGARRSLLLAQRSQTLAARHRALALRRTIQQSRAHLATLRRAATASLKHSAVQLNKHILLMAARERFIRASHRILSVQLAAATARACLLTRAYCSESCLPTILIAAKDALVHRRRSSASQHSESLPYRPGSRQAEHNNMAVRIMALRNGLEIVDLDNDDIYQDSPQCAPLTDDDIYTTDSSTVINHIAASTTSTVENPIHNISYPSSLTSSSAKSPVRSRLLFALTDKIKTSKTNAIRRSKSIPEILLSSLENNDVLFTEISALIPPINRFTLRELDFDAILSNAQLRHDLVFEPDLKFKENSVMDPDVAVKIKEYWLAFTKEVSQAELYRVPLILAEVRVILVELLPSGKELKKDIWNNIDCALISQQIHKSIMNPLPLVSYIAQLLKTNCAPIRDILIDSMESLCTAGDISKCLQTLFEVLELMKLVPFFVTKDYVNHQMTRLLPYIREHSIEFEQRWFKLQFEIGGLTLDSVRFWIDRTLKQQAIVAASGTPSTLDIPQLGFLELITLAPTFSETPAGLPDTFNMDKQRVISFYNDLQDIVILAILLTIYKSCLRLVKIKNSEEVERDEGIVKEELWTLLNDNETTMPHITLHISSRVARLRKHEMGAEEFKALDRMIDTSLSPASPLFQLIQSRVLMHMYKLSPTLLAKHGLKLFTTEITGLGTRVRRLVEFNTVVYGSVYAELIVDVGAKRFRPDRELIAFLNVVNDFDDDD